MRRKRVRAVIFGPQGSGKSTQGHLLSDWFDIPWISSGVLCRQEIEEQTALGKMIEEYVSHGMLAPDDVIQGIMTKRLKEVESEKGFFLDGYPRNVEQAESLDRLMKLNLAVHIKISDQEGIKRLLARLFCPECRTVFHETEAPPAIKGICSVCGGKLKRRDDDNEETIRTRLIAYHFMTEPMMAYYRERGVLLTVNGAQPIESLFQELVKKMAKLGFVRT